jgi:hypothetical protein
MSRFNHSSVAALADSVEAAPSRLLTTGNPKTAKGEGYGYFTAILHLSPWKASGFNTCAGATKGCIAACLNTSGLGAFDETIQRARIRKTKWMRTDRAAFMLQLEKDIVAHVKSATKHGLKPCVRLNGTSDIPWENMRASFANGVNGTIFDRFPDVQFYDYTKLPLRFSKPLPANYDLTFSLADGNERAAEHVLQHGGRVAVVFRNMERPNAQARRWELSDSWNGVAIVDADKHDLRFLEPAGVYCGLKAKGLATRDTTGFVQDITPRKEGR